MISLHGSHNALQYFRLSSGCGGDSSPGDKARHQRIFTGQETQHTRADAYLGGQRGTDAFAFAVDAEQVGTLTADAQHKTFTIDIHAIVLVGNATLQRYDCGAFRTPTGYLV